MNVPGCLADFDALRDAAEGFRLLLVSSALWVYALSILIVQGRLRDFHHGE